MSLTVANKDYNEWNISPKQVEDIHRLCVAGKPVTIKSREEFSGIGTIVQYAVLHPKRSHTQQMHLFVRPENTEELVRVSWGYVLEITGDVDPEPDAAVNKIKRLVAQVLTLPQDATVTHEFVDTIRNQNLQVEDFLKTVDTPEKLLMQCRVIMDLLTREEIDKAKALYQQLDNEGLGYPMVKFDYGVTILRLVQAGIITAETEGALDLDKGVGFAHYVTDPSLLKLHLKPDGSYSAQDFLDVCKLRQDPKVQEIFKKYDLHDMEFTK
jgi:hypothetical protein